MSRDERADYRQAYIAEREAYRAAGLDERAADVDAVLKSFATDEDGGKPTPDVPLDIAVESPAPERAVEDAPKRRPGRPSHQHATEDVPAVDG